MHYSLTRHANSAYARKLVAMLDHDIGSLNLDVLETFDAIMRLGNVSAAARETNATQPVMSQRLRRLRKLVADPLFVRTPSGMVPTSRAEAIARPIAEALALLRSSISHEDRFEPASADRSFVVVASGYGGAILAPQLLTALSRSAPKVRLQLRSLDHNANVNLADGSADVAVGIVSQRPTGFRYRPLFIDTLCALSRNENRSSKRWVIIEGQQLPLPSASLMRRHLPDEQIVLRADDITALPAILEATDLRALLPRRVAKAFAKRYHLSVAELPYRAPEFEIALTWHERRDHDRAHIWFRELIAKQFAS